MEFRQSIQTPLGITVFGSALLRVSPNIANLQFSVSHIDQHPRKVFEIIQDRVHNIRTYLSQAAVGEVNISRINLSNAYEYSQGSSKFIGYKASVDFTLLLQFLDRIEEILVGIVDAGVNNIEKVGYQTTDLKALRAEVRRRAVQAAKEKAQNYCDEANVILGQVLHIEDINPDRLGNSGGHNPREAVIDDESIGSAFEPGSIVITGAVMMTFAIIQSTT